MAKQKSLEERQAKVLFDFIEWVLKTRINVIVLKGTDAVPIRTAFRVAWKQLGLSQVSMPIIYCTGQVRPVPYLDSMTGKFWKKRLKEGMNQNLTRWIEQNPSIVHTLSNPTNRIALVDEQIDTGLSLRLTRDWFRKRFSRNFFSAALAREGTHPIWAAFTGPSDVCFDSITRKRIRDKRYVEISDGKIFLRLPFLARLDLERQRVKMRQLGRLVPTVAGVKRVKQLHRLIK